MEIDILKNDSVQFITSMGIADELKTIGVSVDGKLLKEINTEEIENILREYDYVESAEVAVLANRKVRVEVLQFVPVMRVYASDGYSYYVNAAGKKMKADMKFNMDVPVVTGDFDRPGMALQPIINMVKYISERPELSRYVTILDVKNLKNIYIYPNIRGHVIKFGSPDDFDNKFAKLRQMYDEVIPVKGWWMYDTISVKWKHQIVASRRNKRIPKEELYNPEEDEGPTDAATASIEPVSAAELQAAQLQAKAEEERQRKEAEKQQAAQQTPAPKPAPAAVPAQEKAETKTAGKPVKHRKPGDIWN